MQFHFLMKILPYKESVMTFPELEAMGMIFSLLLHRLGMYPSLVLISSPLTVPAPMASTPPQHTRSLPHSGLFLDCTQSPRKWGLNFSSASPLIPWISLVHFFPSSRRKGDRGLGPQEGLGKTNSYQVTMGQRLLRRQLG